MMKCPLLTSMHECSRASYHKFARLLQDCTKSKDLVQGMLLHCALHEMGFDSGLFLGNTLIHMYAKCGCLPDARYVFENLAKSNLFSWTAVISAYADHGEPEEAIHLYQRICELGLTLDKYVFLAVLKAFISLGSLIAGMTVHAHVIISGFESDVFIANTIMDMYAKCWHVDSARQVFCQLRKVDIISWNVIMTGCFQQGLHEETFAYYLQMQKIGIQPNDITFMLALKACTGCSLLVNGKKIHVQIFESCFESALSLLNTLMHMYAKGGYLDSACAVFNRMSRKDTATWNVMIAAYVDEGLASEAFFLFVTMTEKGYKPDELTFSSILKACAHLATIEHGRCIHFQLMNIGLELDVAANCALIEMYMKCGCYSDASRMFGEFPGKDRITWNAMIMGCAQSGAPEKSFALFEQFLVEGNFPDKATTISVLKACLSSPIPDQRRGNRVLAMEMTFLSDLFVGNTVLELYVECGSLEDAYHALSKMNTRDVVSWNMVIVASIQHGRQEDVLSLFELMLQEHAVPDHITYSSVLKVCATLPALEWGMEIHRLVILSACESSVSVGSALVDMYAKCGAINDAFQVFNSIDERQLVAWTAIIAGCALQGLCKDSLSLFVQMVDDGVKPDTVTFGAVLSSCSRAGLLQEGCYYFFLMNTICCEFVTANHVACIVDLLARAGDLLGAKSLLLSMPIALDAVVWMVLLDACRIHGDVEMGRYACKCILCLDSGCAQAYVVLSNIYALAGMWDEVSKIREEMKRITF
ncbi:hypothetical protein GOP47_0017021 [Adiantum capillus-veneris]|uniref:Pentatricopeptide repeat-containing protein n=1 Tax=Adiantum capillus-veneris TaxID=13818 RepID=A0A9D4UIT2_ADICA|nr:hypothetical protein GOP47_0017021 [Adiantum capillus-veneris]